MEFALVLIEWGFQELNVRAAHFVDIGRWHLRCGHSLSFLTICDHST